MSDVTIESIAAELAELVYDRWMASAAAGYVIEFAAIEALLTLTSALQLSATEPQIGALHMRAAIDVLLQLPANPEREEFQRAFRIRIAELSVRHERRNVTRARRG